MYPTGINLMSLAEALHDDLWGTLKLLKNNGYDFAEIPADFGARPETLAFYDELCGGKRAGWSVEDLKERLPKMREMGFPMKSLFIFTDIIMEQADTLGSFCKEYGVDTVVVSLLDINGSAKKLYEYAGILNRLDEKLKPYGICVCLHNHEIDFDEIADKNGNKRPVFEILLDACKGLKVELDIGWSTYADIPLENFLKKYGMRIKYIHVKDLHKDFRQMDRDHCFVAAGKGAVDIEDCIQSVEKYGNHEVILIADQDNSLGSILEDSLDSVKYLKRI